MIKIKIDTSDFANVKKALYESPAAANRVISRSINKTLTSVNSKAAKLVADSYNLTQKRIKQDFSTIKSTVSNIRGVWSSTGEPIGLTSFKGTRPVKKGVSIKVMKNKPRTILKHAFIARIGGKDNVFWREDVYGRPQRPNFPYGVLPKHYRLPIEIRKGPRIEDELSKDKTIGELQNHADERLQTIIDQETNFELSKL